MKYMIIVMSLLFVMACTNSEEKKNVDSRTYKVYAKDRGDQSWILYVPIYMDDTKFYSKSRTEYKLDHDKDLPKLSKIVCNELQAIRGTLPFHDYFKQYAGYVDNGSIYVYVNLFSYYQVNKECTPELPRTIIFLPDGDYNWGYMIIDYKAGKVVKYKFNE